MRLFIIFISWTMQLVIYKKFWAKTHEDWIFSLRFLFRCFIILGVTLWSISILNYLLYMIHGLKYWSMFSFFHTFTMWIFKYYNLLRKNNHFFIELFCIFVKINWPHICLFLNLWLNSIICVYTFTNIVWITVGLR